MRGQLRRSRLPIQRLYAKHAALSAHDVVLTFVLQPHPRRSGLVQSHMRSATGAPGSAAASTTICTTAWPR